MNQLSSIIDFSQIQSEKAASKALAQALKYINQAEKGKIDKQQSKRRVHEFLTMMHNFLQVKTSAGKPKFYTLLILKITTQNEERLILSVLTSHSLLKYLTSMAKQTDPFLPMNEKGRGLFSDKQLGNDYMWLILQSLKVWGEKFSSNKKNQQSHFKKAYDQLVQRKVVMPSQLKFYKKSYSSIKTNDQLSVRDNTENGDLVRSVKLKSEVEVDNGRGQSQNVKLMEYDIDKIHQFVSLLEGNDYEKHCYEYHKLFNKESVKYESIINQLIASNDEKALPTAFAINQFYAQQDNAFKQFLANKNDSYSFYSYINLIKIKADQLDGAVQKSQPKQTKESLKKQIKVQQTRKDKVQIQTRKDKLQVETQSRKNNLITQQSGKNNTSNQDMDQNKQIVSQLISKLNQKPNKQSTSFRQIKDSLSKDKSLGKLKRSTSGMRKSSISKFGKSITKSRIASIFMTPPNPHPQDKRYQGELIDTNHEMQSLIKNITRNQGIRRFITSNFKSKSPLFQNNHIQIGFKSEAIYEEVSEFKVILSIELYIGNKTEDQINKLSLDYKGDSDVLLYATPKNVQNYLESGYQIKQQLLVVPLNNHSSFIELYLRYNFKGQQFEEKIILPNSIIKLSQNGKLSKKEFVQSWNASSIFRTQEFKLTRYISPDCLSKYIPSLCELSSYDQFLEPYSEHDYQLGCQVMLMRDFEGVLRISVRPNLNAVIQIGITDNSPEAHEGFIYLLQTLQMLLTHVDHQN